MALMGKGKPSIGEPKMFSLYDVIGRQILLAGSTYMLFTSYHILLPRCG